MKLNKKSNGQEYHRGGITEFREALSCVSKCGSDLNFISEDLRNDFEIVRVAVSNCGLDMEFAGENMQDRKPRKGNRGRYREYKLKRNRAMKPR